MSEAKNDEWRMLPTLPAEPAAWSWWRHRKGGLYQVLGVAREEATLAPVVVYRGESGIWTRPHEDFYDGRFTPAVPPDMPGPTDPPGPPANGGSPEYLKLLEEMKELHLRKAADYGRGVDPLANVRSAGEFGIPPWTGVMVRANDKMHRIKSLALNGFLKNESVEDSLMDLAAYSLLALVLYREGKSP